MRESEVRNMNTAALAFMGDAVYEQAVRERILEAGVRRADRLQKIAAESYVNAAAQSRIIRGIFDELEEKEQADVKRWRNYKSHSKPRNADPSDYSWATAFEALLGYLYLGGKKDRLEQILHRSFEVIEDGKL